MRYVVVPPRYFRLLPLPSPQNMSVRRYLVPLLMGNLVGCMLFAGFWRLSASAHPLPTAARAPTESPSAMLDFQLPRLDAPPPRGPIVHKRVHTVRPGQAFGRIAQDLGVSGVPTMIEVARPYADLATIRPG